MNTMDLHMHSKFSLDGEFSVRELLEKGKAAGLKYMSLCDHNSVKGVQEMIDASYEYDIQVIPGIEIDCEYKGVNLHILGYNIDITDKRFTSLETNLLSQEQKLSEKRIQLIEELGIFVNRDKIKQLEISGVVTGEMIGEAAIHEPENCLNPLILPYLENGTRSMNPYVNFYWDFCAQGKPAFLPIQLPNLKDIVSLIHESGGIAIFAHPGNNIHEDTTLLHEIVELGLDGIEVYSSYHSPQQIGFYESFALDKNLLITCGSDFHGKTKPSILFGTFDYPSAYHERVYDTLFKNK